MAKQKPKLGQNFLVDEQAARRIADALGDVRERAVVEIGPGHGAITELLAQRCAKLECIELDPALVRELTFKFREAPQVRIHHQDVLTADFAELAAGGTLDVVGNLPYYITSDILLRLYEAARSGLLRRAVVMMQREVADRIMAAPGSSEYGALSAFTQMHAQVMPLFTLPPGAFNPPPEVYSTVVRMEFRPRFAEFGVEAEGFNRFLRAGFAQKRKMLAKNLRNAGFGAEQIEQAWPEGLSRQVRAEAVELEEMAGLYRGLVGLG